MIIELWEEAAKIVLNEKAKGKKIGHFSMEGNLHNGHRYAISFVHDVCDFSVAYCPSMGSRDPGSTNYTASRFWGKQSVAAPFPTMKATSPETIEELHHSFDLVITGNKPVIPDNKEAEIKEFIEEKYIPLYRKYIPSFFTDDIYNNDLCVISRAAWAYYQQKYICPMDVRITSWKEGIARLIDKKINETFLDYQTIFVEPKRASNGMCISNTSPPYRELESLSTALNLQKTKLITSRKDTRKVLSNKLFPTGWRVVSFEKISGDLLSWCDMEGATYFCIKIVPYNTDKGREYVDAFII